MIYCVVTLELAESMDLHKNQVLSKSVIISLIDALLWTINHWKTNLKSLTKLNINKYDMYNEKKSGPERLNLSILQKYNGVNPG